MHSNLSRPSRLPFTVNELMHHRSPLIRSEHACEMLDTLSVPSVVHTTSHGHCVIMYKMAAMDAASLAPVRASTHSVHSMAVG